MRTSVVLALLSACGTAAPSPEPPPTEVPATTQGVVAEAGINLDDPTTCAPCHATVVTEWQSSMHANAHHDKDPIYAGMRTLRMQKQGEAVAGKCAQCHTPRAPSAQDSDAARAGVSCATCHHLAAVDTSENKKGSKALSFAEGSTLRGPHDVTSDAAPHGVGQAAPWLTDGKTVCLACHGQMSNPSGAPTCTTGTEHASVDDARSCTSCHMSDVQGPSGAVSTRDTHRSHAFHGPHELWRNDTTFMASAVDLSARLEGTTLSAALDNQSQHGVPSGFPGRVVLLKATAFDAAGAQVWTNFTKAPMTENRDAVFNKVYVDAEGAPTLPPFAASLEQDTRLRPGETRRLSWTVPPTATRAELTLLYRLVPPKAVGVLGLDGRPEAGARPIETVAVAAEGTPSD